MNITSKEIARLAGVSRSTVSRVVNGYDNVPEKTRVKIQAIIDQYGYVPDRSARELAGKKSAEIELFIMDDHLRWKGMASPYFMRLISELINVCRRCSCFLTTEVLSGEDLITPIRTAYESRKLTGGIFVGFEYHSDAMRKLMSEGYPMVLIDPDPDLEMTDKATVIRTENEKAGYLAARWLLQKGHRQILHLAGDDRLSARQRREGFRRAMAETGMPEEAILEDFGRFDSARAGQVMQTWLTFYRDHPFTAVFADSDAMAIAAIRAIEKSGRRVPEDISVVGCDYTLFYEELGFTLDSVDIPLEDISEYAVRFLLGQESEHSKLCRVYLKPGETAADCREA